MRELLAVDEKANFKFFYDGLMEFRQAGLSDLETLYVASVLASFALTSRFEASVMPPLADLTEVFDLFVLPSEVPLAHEIFENAGAQTLFFTGFFRRQMMGRHSVRWYDGLGKDFYRRAAQTSKDSRKSNLFLEVGRNFSSWTKTCHDLASDLWDNQNDRFLISH